MKILKLKNAVTEIKILTYGFNIRLDKEKEMSINYSNSHMESKKKREGTENINRDIRNIIKKRSNLYAVIGVIGDRKWTELIFKERMAKNFSKLAEVIKPKIQNSIA